MPALGSCELCQAQDRHTPAAIRLDGVAMCRAHARGDVAAIREQSALNASPEEAIIPRAEPKLLRRPPMQPRAPKAITLPAALPPQTEWNSAPQFVQRLMVLTAEAFSITTGDFWHRSNQHRYVVPRQALVYLLRTHTTLTYPQLSRLLKQHHTTLLYGYEVMRSRVREDEALGRMLQQIAAVATATRTGVAA